MTEISVRGGQTLVGVVTEFSLRTLAFESSISSLYMSCTQSEVLNKVCHYRLTKRKNNKRKYTIKFVDNVVVLKSHET
jgi:hypothetical protein